MAKNEKIKAQEIVNSIEGLDELIKRVKKAQEIYKTFSQEEVDKIFKAAATAADKARIPLAKMAVEETGMGIVEDKIIKNHFASEYIYNKHKNAKTCGIVKVDKTNGIKVVAEPLGVIAGIIPTTNPTSTAIFKSLISLKTRNAIVFSPHPRAKKSTIEAAKISWKLSFVPFLFTASISAVISVNPARLSTSPSSLNKYNSSKSNTMLFSSSTGSSALPSS